MFFASCHAADAELVGELTPWRAFAVMGEAVFRQNGQLVCRWRNRRQPVSFNPTQPPADFQKSALPPEDWIKPGFDDQCWPRYQGDLADFVGRYGAEAGDYYSYPSPALLCLRTCFGISDPARATDLKLTLVCLGGAVVYVNGQEAGRAHLPQGALTPFTPADDYPPEAYTANDGKTPLPYAGVDFKMDPQLAPRYGKRLRAVAMAIPAKLLVKGRNVLAIALHRAAAAGPFGKPAWSHVGFREAKLTSAARAGVIPYEEACAGTRVWSAGPVEQVAETLSPKPLLKGNWFWTLYWGRGMPVKGVQQANPYDPVLPIKFTVPRNGVGSGQTVLSDPAGLRGVTAALGTLKGPSGATLAGPGVVQLRYAVQGPDLHYCDGLMDKPPQGARTIPVWLLAQAPKDQAPGWYVGTLNLQANGKTFAVPVQVLVTGLTLPDAKNFSSTVGMVQSPETVAKQYQVELWSEAHFRLLEPSFALLAQVGNDAVHVPVLTSGVGGTGKSGTRFNWQPMVRWVKDGAGVKPDFTILEKYLDLYVKHCAPPRGLSLYIWGAGSAKEVADAYEGRRIPTRENVNYAPPKVVLWDPKANTTSDYNAPAIGEPGGENFWKPLLEGVRALVTRRGWSERVIMLGLGGDIRPGQKTAELLKQWAPYARWDFLSHFSGDPGPKDGKLIGTGGMEVGMKEWPSWVSGLKLADFEARVQNPYDFLELPTDRWMHQPYSPPFIFRTMTANWGNIGRTGLDFWLARKGGPQSSSFFSHVEWLTVPGPAGAAPTVRFQAFREGLQDAEIKTLMVRSYLKLPEEQRKPYRAILDELRDRMGASSWFISQQELALDWPAYVAKLHLAAAELAGVKSAAKWEQPPGPGAQP
jgi:hypothetical protein